MAETSADVVKRYLEDAIAAEKSFEAQLQEFAKEGNNEAAKAAFHQHAVETRKQYERLTVRLQSLGGSPSNAKSLLAHIFGLSPKTASLGHAKEERTTQNLIMAFVVVNTNVAMYEALAMIAEAAGDSETESLARSIQQEEKATAEQVWALLPGAATNAYRQMTGKSAEGIASA